MEKLLIIIFAAMAAALPAFLLVRIAIFECRKRGEMMSKMSPEERAEFIKERDEHKDSLDLH